MAATKTKKKYYTVEQANAALPLLRLIVRDITVLAEDTRRSASTADPLAGTEGSSRAHEEEVEQLPSPNSKRGQDQMRDYGARAARTRTSSSRTTRPA